MASPILSSLYSVLDQLKFLKNSERKESSTLTRKLGALRTFLLCTIHYKDENLGSLMVRIEDAVCRNARQLELEEGSSSDGVAQISDFLHDIESLEEDIAEWYTYTTLSDFSRPSAYDLLILNSSIINNLFDYRSSSQHSYKYAILLDHPTEDLLDMLVFLRDFIQFGTVVIGVEPQTLEDLLSHFQAVAVNAAHLCAHLLYTRDLCHICSSRYSQDRYSCKAVWDKWSEEKIAVLLQKLQPCDPQVCQIYTQVLTSYKLSLQLSKSTGYKEDIRLTVVNSFIHSLLFVFWNILQRRSHNVIVSGKDRIQLLYEGLRFLRTNMEEETNRFDQKMRHLIEGFLCDAGIIIFSLSQTDVEINLHDVLQVLEVIRAETDGRATIKTDQVEDVKEPSTSSALRSDEVVGFDDQARSIIDRLTRGSKQLQIIAIVGMPGIGKTTLATKVYDHPSFTYYFHVRARCTFSQEFNKRKVLLELLNHLESKQSVDTCLKMSDQDLVEKLRHGLKGRRYLIFLDDVWDIEAWNSLQESFPNDSKGSRIILTSRYSHVAMLDGEPHFLRQLTVNESWELLKKKLLHGNSCPPTLYAIGMEIAERCKGLPLTIIIVAGLLTNLEEEGWQEVLESLTSSGRISSTEQCMNSLELSYKHLPDYLKPCFLYFGVFLEDEVIRSRNLIWLWIGEGFVETTKLESTEDAGMNYLMDLISRSLVMVVKERSSGSVKSCRIHDLLRAFCITKAEEECFFHLLKGYNELLAFNEPPNLQRLCIQSKPLHFKKSMLFCPQAFSLLFSSVMDWDKLDISFIPHIYTSLRVLHIPQILLGEKFPIAITFLQQLRYMAIRGSMAVIPSSIDCLSNLEIFIIEQHSREISLPETLWNLTRLRHLCIKPIDYFSNGSTVSTLDHSSPLHHLESFSGLCFYSLGNIEKELRMFPDIRRLKFQVHTLRLSESEYLNAIEEHYPMEKLILNLDFLSRLESLHLYTRVAYAGFVFPENLKKLTLAESRLPWSKILEIGKLPNLEVLKLMRKAFQGDTWDMEEGECFLKLRFLKLSSHKIVRWTASEGHFPSLQKLVLEECGRLKEIPSCLNTIPDLKMIQVSSCASCIATQVEDIRDMQLDCGNSDFKILIRSMHDNIEEDRV